MMDSSRCPTMWEIEVAVRNEEEISTRETLCQGIEMACEGLICDRTQSLCDTPYDISTTKQNLECIKSNKKRKKNLIKTSDGKYVRPNLKSKTRDNLSSGKVSNSANVTAVKTFSCQYCEKKFLRCGNMYKHMRILHGVEFYQIDSNIKCLECDLGFRYNSELRQHLKTIHNYNMDLEELHFPNMNAFLEWKSEMERETMSSFILANGTRQTPSGLLYYYTCYRSGKCSPKISLPARRRMIKNFSTRKTGCSCTAIIHCTDGPKGVKVKYYPNHYGHGKETKMIATTEEENVLAGGEEKEIFCGNDENHFDHFQLQLIKKRYMRSISKSFKDFEIMDTESIDFLLNSCCKMENCPILSYQKQGHGFKTTHFLLIIMTEFQKHILLNSSKQLICLDTHFGQKVRYFLFSLLVIDEMNSAFPVAYCISSRSHRHVIAKFFTVVKKEVGSLSVQYFMSDNDIFYHDMWKAVMNDNSKWLWNTWCVEFQFLSQFSCFLKGNIPARTEFYKKIKQLIVCQNELVFSSLYNNFIKNLMNDESTKEAGNVIQQKFGSNPKKWAYCYRKDISLSNINNLETMRWILRHCCGVGRTNRFETFIVVLIKLLRDKILYRLSNMRSLENVTVAIDTICIYHKLGLAIRPEYITSLSKNYWLVLTDIENEYFYVTLENEKCPEHCRLKCVECGICIHSYTCSCANNLINANLCEHIHAVVWNFVTPHFSNNKNSNDSVHSENESFEENNMDHDDETSDNSELLDCVLQKAQDVYKKVDLNKCNLNKTLLQAIKEKLHECIDICDGKVIELSEASSSQQTIILNYDNMPITLSSISPFVSNTVKP